MNVKTLLMLAGVVIATSGCTFSISSPSGPSEADQVATIVAATMQALTATAGEAMATQTDQVPSMQDPTVAPGEAVPTEVATELGGHSVVYENVSFVIPGGLAEGADAEKMTAVDSNSSAPWEIAPTHLRFTLTDYELQEKFHQPQVYVYPADEYATMNSNAAFQIENVKRIRAGAPILRETMPRVPWFNADLLITAHVGLVSLQNGNGVRTLTEYAQYYAPINNNELIYQFQGLTEDDRYYIFAILPITAPILPENEKPDAPIPAGGIPIPGDIGVSNTYYFSVTEKLNSLAPDDFTPSLNMLDALIQSIHVKNP